MVENDYEVILADTAEARRLHYNLRYKVYCLEQGWEPAERFPDQLERDEFDARAVHFLLRHKSSGQWDSTLRVVLPESGELPMQDMGVLRSDARSRILDGQVAEVSRVCRPKSSLANAGGSTAPVTASEALIRLLHAAGEYCWEREIRYLYMLCRPAMARMMHRLQVPMRRVGIPHNHRGVRVPYAVDLQDALAGAASSSLLVARLLRQPVPFRMHSTLQRERKVIQRQMNSAHSRRPRVRAA